jgi:hypothetical protein
LASALRISLAALLVPVGFTFGNSFILGIARVVLATFFALVNKILKVFFV